MIGTTTITTLLFLYYAWQEWKWPLWALLVGGGTLLTVDLMFLRANLIKLVHGTWLPLIIAVVAFVVMTTWQRGRHLVITARQAIEGPLRPFIEELAGQRSSLCGSPAPRCSSAAPMTPPR